MIIVFSVIKYYSYYGLLTLRKRNYMAAVMEFVAAVILELAGNAAMDNKKSCIIPHHLQLPIMVWNDEEQNELTPQPSIQAVFQRNPVADQPVPLAAVQAEPLAVVQAEPLAVVQAEPLAVVQAELLAVVQPEPDPVDPADPSEKRRTKVRL